MAKKPKKREKYTSKGIVGTAMKTPAKGSEKFMNKLRAWKAGKPVKLSVPREYDDKGRMIGPGKPKERAIDRWGPPFVKFNRVNEEPGDE